MSMQPSPPDLPPMSSAKPASLPERPVPQSAPASSPSSGMGTKRLRQAVTTIAGGGMVLVVAICGGELVLREGIRPTDLMATIEARTDLGIWNQKLGAKPGELVLTEDQYKARIAAAERGGQAKAELVFQKELAVVQADKEIVVAAYQTLHQRTNIIAQAGLQMAQAQQFRQQLIASTNGGRATVLAIEDGLCAMGSEESCEAARKLRAGMISEATDLTESDLAAKVNELMAGIPDPASFITQDDQLRNGPPTMQR